MSALPPKADSVSSLRSKADFLDRNQKWSERAAHSDPAAIASTTERTLGGSISCGRSRDSADRNHRSHRADDGEGTNKLRTDERLKFS